MTSSYLTSFLPLFLGFLFLLLRKPLLREVQAFFLLASALLLALTALGLTVFTVGQVVLTVVIAEVFHLLVVAATGRRFHPLSHGAILYSLGLFPWPVGFPALPLFWCLSLLLLALAVVLAGGLHLSTFRRRSLPANALSQQRALLLQSLALLLAVAGGFYW